MSEAERRELDLTCGEIVRVRSEAEILATLDARGELDGLPFMPEMRRLCGHRFRVHRRADKTCDTISGEIGARRMRDTVHLEGVRCNGADHGGCQAACLIFWKEAWLERCDPAPVRPLWRLVALQDGAPRRPVLVERVHRDAESPESRPTAGACSWETVERATRRLEDRPANAGSHRDGGDDDSGPTQEPIYRCQITQLLEASAPLSPRQPLQYLRDWLSGNVSPGMLVKVAVLRLATRLVWGRGFSLKVRLYDRLARAFGEPAWPYHPGRLDGRTPTEKLDLKPGDLVEVKSHAEILATLNGRSNRGLSFAPEMVRYCGGTYRVRARVEKIIDEPTGRMLHMKNDCIVLEDVVCQSECSARRLFCPRGIYPYWREIWLRRAEPGREEALSAPRRTPQPSPRSIASASQGPPGR